MIIDDDDNDNDNGISVLMSENKIVQKTRVVLPLAWMLTHIS